MSRLTGASDTGTSRAPAAIRDTPTAVCRIEGPGRAEEVDVAARGKDRRTREQRERARAYQARLELHDRQGRRRTRDNLIGLIVGLLVIAGAIALQTAYFVTGPGAPTPEQSSTVTPETPVPTEIPAPLPSESTAP